MKKFYDETEVWEKIISYTDANPLDFQKLETHYDIGKLELQKFSSMQVRSKQKEFQLRYCKQSEQTSKTWMQNEYRLFMWFVLGYFKMIGRRPQNFTSDDWELIAEAFKKQSNNWVQGQDDIIQALMKSNISKKWTDIGLELFKESNGRSFRKPKAIRERWLSHLNPEIKKQVYIYPRAEWTLEEELDLMQKIKEFGKKWSKIAKILGNRSEHTVKNRYNKIKQKYEKQMIGCDRMDEFCESQMIDKIVNEYEKRLFLNMERNENERKLLNGSQQTILCSNEQVKIEVQHIEMNFLQAQIFQPIVLIFPSLSR